MSESTSRPVVGFIGLGLIGAPIAVTMAEGLETIGYDIARKPGDVLGKVRIVADIAALVAASDIVCLCLPSAKVSENVTRAIADAKPRRATTVVELSTIGMKGVEACHAIAAQAGLRYVDAPVSGGVARAATGKLSIMAAASEDALAIARPALEQISARIFVMGEKPGLGQAMKVANNIIGATSLAVTSEAVVFGTRLGLDMAKMIEVINASTGRTEPSEVKFPNSIIPRKFKQGARSAIMRKDVQLYMDDAKATGMPAFISAATDRLWGEFNDTGPDNDFSLIYKYIEDLAGPVDEPDGKP